MFTGTLLNAGTVLLGTLLGTLFGARLPDRMQQRVLTGLALVTLVLGVDNALAWRRVDALYVLGGVLLGGLAGEALDIEGRLRRVGDRLQGLAGERAGAGSVSEAFFTASVLFCVGPLAVVGAIQNGITGHYDTLATKALLDGFASIALASTLGPGVGLAALSVLVLQGGLTLAAGALAPLLRPDSPQFAALTSAGGILIIGIALKLADLRDVRVANFLPALVIAPGLVGLVGLLR